MKKKKSKLIPEMLNLLGCNKENFVKLIKKMNYKTYEKKKNYTLNIFHQKNNIRKIDQKRLL